MNTLVHEFGFGITAGIQDFPGVGERNADAAAIKHGRKNHPMIAAEMMTAETMGKGKENAAAAGRGVGKRIAESAPSIKGDGRKVTGKGVS